MAFEKLSEVEQQMVFQCTNAIADSSVAEDWGFQTRLGIARLSPAKTIPKWPGSGDSSEDSDDYRAVANSSNEVSSGLDVAASQWSNYWPQPKEGIRTPYLKWPTLPGSERGGIR